MIHGKLTRNYAEFYARTRRLASALAKRGIKRGDTVSVMLANTPAMIEAHYGVPMTQGVLNTLNTRLDAAIIAFSLDHAETKVLIIDREFSKVMKEALSLAKVKPLVIDYDDPEYSGRRRADRRASNTRTSSRTAIPDFAWHMPDDEWDAIALNYTSGTTGDPEGRRLSSSRRASAGDRQRLTCAHGASIRCICGRCRCSTATAGASRGRSRSSPARMSACARCAPRAMFDAIATHKVTHLCGAPIVMATLLNAPEAEKKPLPHVVEFFTAAAPPPEAVLAAMKDAGFNVTHLYGLTECYGPAVVNDWHDGWDALPPPNRRRRKRARACATARWKALDVTDPDTMVPVPRDGETMGEVMMRGNVVMKGYLKNKASTDEGLRRRLVPHRRSRRDASGRLHPAQGPLQGHHHLGRREHLVDRGRGRALQASRRAAAAVVAKPDEKWGETPCAFVELKPGARPPPTT